MVFCARKHDMTSLNKAKGHMGCGYMFKCEDDDYVYS